MNKSELIAAMAEKSGLSKKDSEAALKAFVEAVSEELQKKEKVQLIGFGTFETSERAARTGRNPQTGEAIKIKKSVVPKFRPGASLKELVNTKPKKTAKKK
ncbi:MAG: HU family DNA-binding protein [Blautia sp.]|nr:HU family DNA-binding protein [Blautia sp.]